jgi:hypothetical protein
MAHKVIVPQNKNYVPQFLKQRYINSYKVSPWFSKNVYARFMISMIPALVSRLKIGKESPLAKVQLSSQRCLWARFSAT